MTPDTGLIQQRKAGQICIVARTAVLSIAAVDADGERKDILPVKKLTLVPLIIEDNWLTQVSLVLENGY